MADCCLVDLNGIEACPLLQLLDASGNSISSIEHLAESGLTQLTSLKLQSNDIENLDALDNAPFMNTLTHLDLNHNMIRLESKTLRVVFSCFEFVNMPVLVYSRNKF